ncbi:16S rRNA (cytidine(1402)-2'-O)-methyltransferase [Aestuariispira ectoiniformans]|uniref:16S rRNA (cytidine(1402)-2'-O)-methyltransferase n=1 Tax=Aestuariispira ectoiniformans TaxID=2775080 RepID=UPI00223BA2F4|nr:16S rRNA (cytidine(1402)-2'-O)-methyltransferase [Aestuariispira ectoiniformans]
MSGQKVTLAPGLYPVATPIGNLRDITLRALDVLSSADVIACEDSRITKRLLQAYGITTPVIPYHEHNAASMRPRILERIEKGEAVVLVSDAGTPLISDPGFKLVRALVEADGKVYPIPGASAPITALSAAGLPSDHFLFVGFPPNKQAARRKALETFSHIDATLIFFESPKRLKDCLTDMADLWPDRQAVVARELTKMFEEFRRMPLTELAASYIDQPTPKGEIVILVEPPHKADEAMDEEDLDGLILKALETQSLRDASADVASVTGLPKKQVYKRALDLSKNKD